LAAESPSRSNGTPTSALSEPESHPSVDGTQRIHEAIGRIVARLIDLAPPGQEAADRFDEVLHTMAVEGTGVVADTQCVISLVPVTHPEIFRVVAASGDWAETLVGKEWPLHEGMLHGRAMLNGKPVETTDAPTESAAPEVFGREIRTGRLVPMTGASALPDGRIGMGVVGFWRSSAQPYSDVERAIMDRFTQLVSIVLLGDEARRSTAHLVHRLRLSAEATRELSSSLEPEQVVQSIIERIADLVEVDRITLATFRPDEVEAIAGYDRTRIPARIGTKWRLTPELRGAIDRGEAAFEGFSDVPGMPEDMRDQLSDVRRRLIVPLTTGGRVRGMLAVSRRSDHAFSPLDLENLEQIALAAALALHNARLFAESKTAQEKALQALLRVSDHLGEATSEGELYSRFASTVAELVAARRVTLWRLSPDQRSCHIAAGAHGVRPEEFEAIRPVPSDANASSIAGRVVFGDAVFLGRGRDLGMAIPSGAPPSVRDGEADAMAVAWRAGAIRLGALAAHDPIRAGGFSEEDAWILRLAAFATGLVWQIKTAEGQIRALGDAEAGRLREHIERMQSMEKMKSDFLKLASHELRGPIAIVRGYYSMMADGSLDSEALERAIPVIGRKLDDMNGLVNEMLETARLDEGLTRLDRQPHDLRAIVTAATTSVQPQLRAPHRLLTRSPHTPVMVDVDAGRIETILRNLLDNAIKFSPDGGDIACHVSVGAGSARVHVIDKGLGIAAEQMHRLFTRFSRLVTPENSHILGTGLGLYLSRELARLHGGDITVRSTPNVGSRFLLTLPLSQPAL
jgi:signal transduction histidine kinase